MTTQTTTPQTEQVATDGFEPQIVCFACNWCSYAGADLAGVSRIQYPPNIRIIRVMCSGRIDPTFVLKALHEGIDGVLICGCHIGDCHYIDGNHKTARRIPLLKKLLGQLGIEEERVRLAWVSASEGDRFASIVKDTTEQIRRLGPFRPSDDMQHGERSRDRGAREKGCQP
jgi:F420-non-reducing hydrogenase iron-sulfur subunit